MILGDRERKHRGRGVLEKKAEEDRREKDVQSFLYLCGLRHNTQVLSPFPHPEKESGSFLSRARTVHELNK